MDVYRTGDTRITVDQDDGTTHEFLFNPRTGYVLMTASAYGNYSGPQLQEIEAHDDVEGVFNSDRILPYNYSK